MFIARLCLQLPHDALWYNFTLQINTMALKRFYCKAVQYGQFCKVIQSGGGRLLHRVFSTAGISSSPVCFITISESQKSRIQKLFKVFLHKLQYSIAQCFTWVKRFFFKLWQNKFQKLKLQRHDVKRSKTKEKHWRPRAFSMFFFVNNTFVTFQIG